MKLFSTGKTGVFLESLTHRMEKRKSGEVKVEVLSCAISPLTVQLAGAIDESVRGALYRRTDGAEPHHHVGGIDFRLAMERQDIEVFTTPDTEKASIVLDQVKIEKLRARLHKDSNAYTFTFKAVFMAGAKQAEFVRNWLYSQRFLSFNLSEPDLDLIDTDDEADEEPETMRPAPMFDDDPEQKELVGAATATGRAAPDRANRRMHTHAGGRRGGKKHVSTH